MYKEIKSDNEIFNSNEFQNDKYKFNIIIKNLSSLELELYSDEENYIICRGAKNIQHGFGQKIILINQLLKRLKSW